MRCSTLQAGIRDKIKFTYLLTGATMRSVRTAGSNYQEPNKNSWRERKQLVVKIRAQSFELSGKRYVRGTKSKKFKLANVQVLQSHVQSYTS